MPYDFSVCKFCRDTNAVSTYRIRDGIQIYCCPSCGGHYIDYLDDNQEVPTVIQQKDISLTQADSEYIEKQLQSNAERFNNHVSIVQTHRKRGDLKVLDVGAGGGLFLKLLRDHGIDGCGIEPNAKRICFAKEKYGIELSPKLIDDVYWQKGYNGDFDVITLWDVIEHVNFPDKLLKYSNRLLKDGGLLFLDTPMRNGFYYRIGELSYKFSFGKYPLFLNTMYSKDKFAHKQIFSSQQLFCLLQEFGFEVVSLQWVHELSFPYIFYLKRFLHSDRLASIAVPFCRFFFKVLRIRNKIVLVARKTHENKL